jgi:hypothetical protein
MMKKIFGILALFLTLPVALAVSASAQAPEKTQPEVVGDITGLYSFLHEGEFVQIEVNDGKVTGLVSHFKDEDPDKAEFVDQFFEQAKLEGTTLTFRTKVKDDLWFEFSGTVERGSAKTPSDEGYWTLRGTVTEHHNEAGAKAPQRTHSVTLKSFPQDAEQPERKGTKE